MSTLNKVLIIINNIQIVVQAVLELGGTYTSAPSDKFEIQHIL